MNHAVFGLNRASIFSSNPAPASPASRVENSLPSSIAGWLAHADWKACCVAGDAVNVRADEQQIETCDAHQRQSVFSSASWLSNSLVRCDSSRTLRAWCGTLRRFRSPCTWRYWSGCGPSCRSRGCQMDPTSPKCRMMERWSGGRATTRRRSRSDSLSPPATIRPLRCTIVTPPRSRVSSERRNVFKNAAESKPAKSPCYMPRGAPEAEWFPATSKVGLLKQDDRDSAILASEVRIAFEFGVRSKKFPGQVI
jgi:hypothetical protein